MGSSERIKNIIFDFGGVILNIDHEKVEHAFIKLGLDNFDVLFNKASQSKLFQDFEIGSISPQQFRKSIQELTGLTLGDKILDDTWNEIICDYPPERIKVLKRLALNYRLFLLSNTNQIHFDFYIPKFKQEFGFDFISLFEKAYWSFEIGLRKPDPDPFEFILKNAGILSSETLFIDDSIQNINAAGDLGFFTYHLKDSDDLVDLFVNDRINTNLIFENDKA